MIEFIALGTAAFLEFGHNCDKSNEITEAALRKYSKAYMKAAEAQDMVYKAKEYAELRVQNVAKKKRNIVEYTFPRFEKTYKVIQEVVLKRKDKQELANIEVIENINSQVNEIAISISREYTDREFVLGFGKGEIRKAEKFKTAANSQMRLANVIESQAETICVAIDAITKQADLTSNVLVSLNFLFTKLIDELEEIVNEKGKDSSLYTEKDIDKFYVCANFAVGISDILKKPLLDERGVIAEESYKAIEAGNKYINEMNYIMKKC